MLVQFSPLRLAEYADARAFNHEVGPWLVLREAENCYLLGDLPRLIWEHDNGKTPKPRFFALKDREQIISAMVLHPQGGLVITWTSPDVIDLIVDQLGAAKCAIGTVFGPGFIAWQFARAWAAKAGAQWESGREERVYQLARIRHNPTGNGKLAPVTTSDDAVIVPWFDAFCREAEYQNASSIPDIRNSLIKEQRLFFWCDPHPVSMAAWVTPTPHGGSINFVYTPPEFRGKGYGKNVCAALAKRVLDGGARYCFILTDTGDKRSNHMYQKIGARTVAELLQCSILPAATPSPRPSGGGQLNVNFNQ